MKKLVITTSNSIEGKTISEYLDPISANVVLGANFFSDIAAGLTDIFGGRSAAYEKKLRQLHEIAISKLKMAGRSINADGIIGLKIDIDEVSGKSNQMFMITAYGTPVRMGDSTGNGDYKLQQKVDGAIVSNKLKAKRLLEAEISPANFYTDDNIQFIVDSRLPEFIDIMLNGIKFYTSGNTATIDNETKNKKLADIAMFFSAIDVDVVSDAMYAQFYCNSDILYLNRLAKIIEQNDLLNYDKIGSMLMSDNTMIAKYGLYLLSMEKQYYSQSDRAGIEKIIEKVSARFKPEATIVTKKKLLSSSEVEIWNCTCGRSNDMTITYCTACEKDIYGFHPKEKKPSEVIQLLKDRVSIIDEMMAEFNNAE